MDRHHQNYNCVDQKIVRSDQFVNFDAQIKVRTNVRLLDVDIEANCVCADDRQGHTQGTINEKYVRVVSSTANKTPVIEKTTFIHQTPDKKTVSGVTLTGKEPKASPVSKQI